jgi:hypothetical protein
MYNAENRKHLTKKETADYDEKHNEAEFNLP